MPSLSTADHRASPPRIHIPRDYNAAHDLIERNLAAGRAGKIAYIDDAGAYTYGELAERVNRCANALIGLGLRLEERVLLCLLDTIDFPAVVPRQHQGRHRADRGQHAAHRRRLRLHAARQPRARARRVGAAAADVRAAAVATHPHLAHVIVSGAAASDGDAPHHSLAVLTGGGVAVVRRAETTCDDVCFWLYSSGSTGSPKGTVHVHASLIQTAELYAAPVLGIREDDVVFSAAKLFFAYGLGNALTFPLAVGATAVLMAERPTPAAVFARLAQHQPTIFYGVPTLYAALLASPMLPRANALALRRCVSAGEALPADIGKRWTAHFGVDILDGIGSTEMLHIFLSNRPGDVRYGTTRQAGAGLRAAHRRRRRRAGCRRARSASCRSAGRPPRWRTGTTATRAAPRSRALDAAAATSTRSTRRLLRLCGRSDDMLKVSGIYVSPVEVESALITHAAVLEAAVVGREDDEKLSSRGVRGPEARSRSASPALADELRQHVKSRLAPYKYPRWIEFIDELPKTATGKIQRFKLRASAR